MGAFTSRRRGGVEEVEISGSVAYRYPPKSGCYFGSHFIMGGEKFETTQPETYLFGENADLNFLGNRPTPFPYPAPQAHEPTKTLKSLVNIRKDSLKFSKVLEDSGSPSDEEEEENDCEQNNKYNIEFTFDSDVKVAITIYYFATEDISNGHVTYTPRDPSMNSETYHYKRGANQSFNQTTHVLEPGKFGEEEWQYNPDKEVFPIVIQCVVEEEQHAGHSHMLLVAVEKSADGQYIPKPLKQKQMVDGLCYLLQEIYGIENKSPERVKLDDEFDDNGSECVICMCESRDTLILPCRHLCLCNLCADNLRYQANNCPICRAPFRALLQIRALKKKMPLPLSPTIESSEENSVSQEGVPPGYEAVSLIEALNGPDTSSQPTHNIQTATLPPDGENYKLDKILYQFGNTSPTVKRKGRRSSSRSSRRSRRAQEATVQLENHQQSPVVDEVKIVRETNTEHTHSIPIQQSCDVVAAADTNYINSEQHLSNDFCIGHDMETCGPESQNNGVEASFQIENDASSASDEQVAESPTDYQEITIQDEDVDNTGLMVGQPPSYSSLTLDKESLDTSTNDEDKPLCLLQLSLPSVPTEGDEGSRGSSYSSASSSKGLLDGEIIPQITEPARKELTE